MALGEEQTVLAFDLYGTLLSTESIAKQLSSYVSEGKAAEVAASWRRYQLEYTWRLNSMEQYKPFSTITRNSLAHAFVESNISLDEIATEKLMRAYDALSVFPDVLPALEQLRDASWITPVVFSNGSSDMVVNSVKSSPDLSPSATIFKKLISVESVKCFKPNPKVYYHLAAQMSKTKEEIGGIWLISGNPFDIVGANAVGMKTAWVNRKGLIWTDELVQGDQGRPTIVAMSLEDVVAELKRISRPT